MSDIDTAVQRLTAWVRDYGDSKPREFIGDVTMLLVAAKESSRLHGEIERLRDIVAHCRRYAPSVVAAAEGAPMQQGAGL